MTSLYQVTLRGEGRRDGHAEEEEGEALVLHRHPKGAGSAVDREEAIVGVPEDRIIRTDFGREVVLDLSAAQKEYAALMYPVCQVFDWDKWQDGFDEHWRGDQNESVRGGIPDFQAPGSGELQVLPRAGHRAGPIDFEGSRLRRLREGEHRRQGARRLRAGDGDVCRLRPRTAQGLVRRRCDEGPASPLRRDAATGRCRTPGSSPGSPTPISFRRSRYFIRATAGAPQRRPASRARSCRRSQATGRRC